MSRQLYPVVAGPVPTALSESFKFGSVLSIKVDNPSDIPSAPNIITIADDTNFITVEYQTLNVNELTDLTFIEGNYNYLFPVGSEVVRAVAKYDFDAIADAISESGTDIQDHISDTNNPHSVTKEQVGLSDVDNTSDLDKPVSTATQNALDGKVDKVSGKGLSSNDFTDAYKNKIDSVESDLSTHIEDMENPHEVTKAQVGLGNVDNTSDVNKPISNATQSALDLKADDSSLQEHISDTDNPHDVTKSQVGLSNVDNTSDLSKPISTATQGALDGKVDKETGKALSSNDFTTAYKNKVDNTANSLNAHIADTDNPHEVTASQIGVEDGAEVNVIEGVQINGIDLTITSKKVNIPIASASVLGTIKIGDNLTIDSTGKVSATASAQVQADWSETDSEQPSFIKGKPELGTASEKDVPASGNASSSQVVLGSDTRLTDSRSPTTHASSHVSGTDVIPNATTSANGLMSSSDKTKLNGIEAQAQKNVKPDWNATAGSAQEILNKPTAVSEFTNDSNYQTNTQVNSTVSTHNSSTSAHSDIRQSVSAEVSRAEGEEQSLQNQIDALASRTDVADVVATYADLDLSKYLVNDIVKVMQDETRGGAISYYKVQEVSDVKSWLYIGSQGPFYTKSEADNYFVPQQRTVNGKSLANNVTLTADDVDALPDDTTLADLSGDATHRVVTDSQISSWNAKQGALTFDNTPTASSSNPVKSGGIYTALSGKADDDDLQAHIEDTSNPHSVTKSQVGLGNVDNTSDANKPVSTATQTALDGKVDKVTGKGLSTNDFTTTLKNKLDGIESGAQVNVQADWTATTAATGAIKNKPTLGDSASKNVGTTAGTVCAGNDSRLSNARSPTAHASTHAAGAADEITPAAIGAEPAIGTKGTAFNKDFGTSAGTVCQGNDSRLSDARTPTAHTHAAGDITSGTLADARIPSLAASKITSGTFDVARIPSLTKSKISDFPTSMTPTAHASSHASGGSDAIAPADIGAAPTSHRSTSTTYGAASNAYYGHAKASSTIPKDLGATANTGTELDSYSRGDHIHRNPIIISTSDPSGGVSGDVWFKYQA